MLSTDYNKCSPFGDRPPTVVVGLSGGVDSSVAALLLQQQGYRVVGLFMKNWDDADDPECSASQDYEDVSWLCSKLDIPFYSVNFVKEYKSEVFAHFVDQYAKGFTPNPDILCNRKIKFKAFFQRAMELGADYLATGHYCRISDGQLVKSVDLNKDQSYFLSAIDGSVLSRVLFPIGDMEKSAVRALAKQYHLPSANKKDSTGICFIGERKFRPFLQKYLKVAPGDFCTLDGTKVGRHYGASYYTLGQRKQLGLGGQGERWYVVKKDHSLNIVYVERGDHPQLYCDEIVASDPVWINYKPSFLFHCSAKLRYRQQDQVCRVSHEDGGKKLRVSFDRPQRAAAPGQTIAFYQDDICLGSAVIQELGPS